MKPEMHIIEPDDSCLRRHFAFTSPGFIVPFHYFEELQQSVFWQLKNQLDPDIKISINSNIPFQIPSNYFEDFNSRFFMKLELESNLIEQELASFENSELGKILLQKGPGFTKNPIVVSKSKRFSISYRWVSAIAAMLFITFGLWYVNKPSVKLIEPSYQSFNQASNELTDEEFIQILEDEDIQPEQLADISLNNSTEGSKQTNSDSLKSSDKKTNQSVQPADEEVEQFLLDQADESLIESL